MTLYYLKLALWLTQWEIILSVLWTVARVWLGADNGGPNVLDI